MAERVEPNVFYLPPGVDFATQLVLGLRERMADSVPEAMAQVKLFVNSQRMRRRITEVMTQSGGGFLPIISVITEIGAGITLSDLSPPASVLRQKLELARLVKQLLVAQPELAASSARFDLAESLAALLAEMQDEGVEPEVFSKLDVSGHSAYWGRTQSFLDIIAPLYLSEGDQQPRQREAVSRMERAWRDSPPKYPIIVAGSTGSRGTTARFIQAVASLEKGAAVLPGFDSDLPGHVWAAMNDEMTAEDHPQFRFRKLMLALGIGPEKLRPWRETKPHDPERNRLISLAMRPAPVTDQWLLEGLTLGNLEKSTENLTLIEATNPKEEAVAIALALRESVDQGRRAALITPDRSLTRRVAAELARWDLVPDDSAGNPLAMSAVGRLLRHVARAFVSQLTADQLLVLLKHPLVCSTEGRGAHLAATRELEATLRYKGPAFPSRESLVDWAGKTPDDGKLAWAEWVGGIIEMIEAPKLVPLSEHVRRHFTVSEALSGGPTSAGADALWRSEAGIEARALMNLLAKEAPFGEEMSASDYVSFFEIQINQGEVRETYSPSPLVAFYGHREAREMHAELVIVGGLTDGIWPSIGDPDPWLNRKMRRDCGLLLPERQIGLAAHDFQQAAAAQKVILTRSVRDSEAETVPSRWLNRLCNLMDGLQDRDGPRALRQMRARGKAWLELARTIDRPTTAHRADQRLLSAVRPSPCPPVSSRPSKLSLSRISTLIRDPYAIYGRHILNLKPLDPLRREPEDRERGTLIHKILEDFVKTRPFDETLDQARHRVLTIAAQVLENGTPFPSARLLWMARLERAAGHLLRQDAKYHGTPVVVEESGSLVVGETGFTLFGTPDRIDLLPDGRLHLIDYKTGIPPTAAQQEAFEKQLLLAAAMAERGGFAKLGPREVARISYIGLGSGERVVETELDCDTLAVQWERFKELILAYQKQETGFAARRAIFETRFQLDYDHLSRFGEWQMSDRATPVIVGDIADAK